MPPKLITNKELDILEQEVAKDISSEKRSLQLGLGSFIQSAWEKAKTSKRPIEDQILKNMRQRAGQYESDKLAAISVHRGSEIYLMLTDCKCWAAEQWINDLVLPTTNELPFSIEISPEPIVSEEEVGQIETEVRAEMVQYMLNMTAQTGKMPNMELAKQDFEKNMIDVRTRILKMKKELKQKKADIIENKVADALVEGNWDKALSEVITDVILKTGIMRGPIFKKVKHEVLKPNAKNGTKVSVEEELIPFFERRNPLFIYPEPGSIDVNDGFLIDRISIDATKLQDFIGVDGWNENVLKEIIEDARVGASSLREWLGIDTDILEITGQNASDNTASNKVDILNYWGPAYGEDLLEYGVKPSLIPDPKKYYDIEAYYCDGKILAAVLNPSPIGKKPYYKCSFEERKDSWFGLGLPEKIADLQTVCNAVGRAIHNNVALASGPQVEINVDRTEPGQNFTLIPWKVYFSNEGKMGGSNQPAINFYQPELKTGELTMTLEYFVKKADEWSGIPGFSHGDPNVSGAGNTSSGFAMLYASSARGVKGVVKNIDRYIIEPSVQSQHMLTLLKLNDPTMVDDYHVIAKGSSSIIAKEQQQRANIDFLNLTNNPTDFSLMTGIGRKYLLEEAARSLSLDPDKLFPEGADKVGFNEGINRIMQQAGGGAPTTPDQTAIPPGAAQTTMPGPPALLPGAQGEQGGAEAGQFTNMSGR